MVILNIILFSFPNFVATSSGLLHIQIALETYQQFFSCKILVMKKRNFSELFKYPVYLNAYQFIHVKSIKFLSEKIPVALSEYKRKVIFLMLTNKTQGIQVYKQ